MFYGFDSRTVRGDGVPIFIRRKGTGPPLLLLHGFPQTHVMWHRVAPPLASRFTVVCADLRGYGASGKPRGAADHSTYSKRTMAADLVAAMAAQGFDQFAVVGHDRGARVAYRLALDHAPRVTALAVLDIVPTATAFALANRDLVVGYWPWSLFAQPSPLPERLIAADPEAIVDHALAHWGTSRHSIPSMPRDAYVQALRDPATAHAICEEFRAAATLDVEHDEETLSSGQRIAAPTLVLWSEGGPLDRWYAEHGGPLGIWRRWADVVSGMALPGGHFFPESNPRETLAALMYHF